jgi:glyoxylase-like metal-dependent hydrolase (beta-lactamase superfamily II)
VPWTALAGTVGSMAASAIEPRYITTGVYMLPFAVSNVYVWDWNDGVTLIDTGIPGSAATILEALASLGRSPEDVKEIVLTHFHRDLTGDTIAAHEGAPILGPFNVARLTEAVQLLRTVSQ